MDGLFVDNIRSAALVYAKKGNFAGLKALVSSPWFPNPGNVLVSLFYKISRYVAFPKSIPPDVL